MKIAVNARMLLKGRMEGICRYIHETTKRMVKNHPDDEFIFLFDRPFHPSFIYGPNVTPVVVSPPTRDPILWKIWFDYSIPRILKKYKVDIFLSGDTYASLRIDVPTIIVSHDIAYHHYPEHLPKRVLKYYQKNFPLFHQNAAHIIAVSEFTKNDIAQVYNLNPDKITVAYNALPEGFHPMTEEEKMAVRNQYTQGAPFIMYLGSIHPRKNVDNLVAGFEHYKRIGGNQKLVVFGRKAWKYETFESKVQDSPYRKDIIIIDGVKNDPRNFLPAAEAMAYVSYFEGFGIPILEAMASGVPVITSNVSSMPEVAGGAALLVDPDRPEEIGDALGDLEKDENKRKRLIELGYNRIKDFSWEKSGEIIYDAMVSNVKGK